MDICLPGAPGAPLLLPRAPRPAGATARSRAGPRPPRARRARPRTPSSTAFAPKNSSCSTTRTPDQFEAMADALADDLAPVGALQALLARRLVVAAWRLERAERIERELFALAGRAQRARLGPARPRPGARRQRAARVRHPPALPRLGHGRALARAAGAQGVPGRGARPSCEAPDRARRRPTPTTRSCPPAAGAAADEQPIEPEARENPG